MEVAERVEDLRDPSLPGLKLDRAVISLGLAQELLQRSRGHVLRDEDQPRQLLVYGLRAGARVPALLRRGRCGGGGGQSSLCKVEGM